MSRRLLPLLCCLCLAVPARAETLNVGGTDIAYTVPEGYVIGDGPRYAELIEFASRAQPPDIRILSIYVTEKDNAALLAGTGARDNFLIISVNRQMEKQNLRPADFAQLRDAVATVQNQKKSEVQSEAERLIDSASNGNLGLGGLEFLGCSDDGPARFSCLTVLTQIDRSEGKEYSSRQAALSTWLLTQGKLLQINQYENLDQEMDLFEQAAAFQTRARHVVDELNIPPDTAGSGLFQDFPGRLVLVAVLGGLIGGLAAMIRKKKTPAV